MRASKWLIVSLLANLILLAAVSADLFFTHLKPAPPPSVRKVKGGFNPFAFYVRTNVVVRKQNFTWHEVESSDYETYIRNLRTIGCPEQTIRDLIVADVDQLYAYRRAAEVTTNDFQWWRSDPDTNELQRVWGKLKGIEEERRALLTRLLGPNWDKPAEIAQPASRGGINLNGPVLGDLPNEAKQRVYEIAARAQQRRDAYLEAQKQTGLPPEAAEMARIRQAMRGELTQILNPEQLEEFLLRYSETAEKMRREFKGLELTPDEFRSIFRARDPVEQEIDLLGSEPNPSVGKRLQTLRSQVEDTVRRALGNERYSMLKLNQDPLFRETKSTAQRVGASPEAMLSMYEINREAEAERQRIRRDTTLTSEERIEALAAIQAEQQKSLERLLGQETFQRLTELQERKLP